MQSRNDYTIRLTPEQASVVQSMLLSGSITSENEVIDAGLGALRGQRNGAPIYDVECPELTIEQVAEVKHTLAEIDSGRMKMIPAEEVWENIRALHAETVAKRNLQ